MEPCKIPLRNRAGEVVAFALVDAEDYEDLNRYRWCRNSNGYAVRGVRVDGKQRTIRMHRQILWPPEGMQADHINRDKLDNRRENLRAVTNRQNNHNRSDHASGVPGVYWLRRYQRWQVRLRENGEKRYFGYFRNVEVAEIVRDHHLARITRDEQTRLLEKACILAVGWRHEGGVPVWDEKETNG